MSDMTKEEAIAELEYSVQHDLRGTGAVSLEAIRILLRDGYAPEGFAVVPVKTLKHCSDELAEWVEGYYTPEARAYPSEERRYQRDIAPVVAIRAMLDAKEKSNG